MCSSVLVVLDCSFLRFYGCLAGLRQLCSLVAFPFNVWKRLPHFKFVVSVAARFKFSCLLSTALGLAEGTSRVRSNLRTQDAVVSVPRHCVFFCSAWWLKAGLEFGPIFRIGGKPLSSSFWNCKIWVPRRDTVQCHQYFSKMQLYKSTIAPRTKTGPNSNPFLELAGTDLNVGTYPEGSENGPIFGPACCGSHFWNRKIWVRTKKQCRPMSPALQQNAAA